MRVEVGSSSPQRLWKWLCRAAVEFNYR
uniref:Uncharacterized protein n=1 Tax=Anguilla anguilla TaxID=7936 RepID=A0A0E9VY76_ANGAN